MKKINLPNLFLFGLFALLTVRGIAVLLEPTANNIITGNRDKPAINNKDYNIKANIQATSLEESAWAAVFGIEYKKNDASVITEKVAPSDFNFANYELLGTIVKNRLNSSALILQKNTGVKTNKHIGDKLDDFTISDIRRSEITLRDATGRKIIITAEYKKLFEKPAKTMSIAKTDNRNGEPPQSLTNSVFTDGTKTAGNSLRSRTVNLTRDEVNNVIYKELEKILTTTNIVPYFENNKMTGIRFNKLNETGVISRYFGVKVNDIIVSINGKAIDSIEKGMKLWDNIKTENYITLDIIRNDMHYLYSLNIEG